MSKREGDPAVFVGGIAFPLRDLKFVGMLYGTPVYTSPDVPSASLWFTDKAGHVVGWMGEPPSVAKDTDR